MRKLFALSMAAVMAAGALTGCSGGSGSGATQAATQAAKETAAETNGEKAAEEKEAAAELSGELSVMVNNAFTGMDDPAIVRAAKTFEEANPGVKITIEGLAGKELISKFTTPQWPVPVLMWWPLITPAGPSIWLLWD